MTLSQPKETWPVEVKSQSTGTWHTDTTGEVIFSSETRAREWAQKLHVIYPDVRLKHTIDTYEAIQF